MVCRIEHIMVNKVKNDTLKVKWRKYIKTHN